jgi:GPH family glycoside/pentoside/hexuronide:cation symporter
MLLIAAQMFNQAYYIYVFDYYFKKPGLYMMVMVCSYLPIGVLMFVTNKLIGKFGKKALCSFGLLFAAIVNFVMFFLHTQNVYVFLALCFVAGMGSTFFILEIWAMVNDVIDYHEIKTGIREEATTYSFFSFTRKLGQTVAGVISTQALVWIGYKVGDNVVQSEATVNGMYNIALLVPACMFLLNFIMLWFFYPTFSLTKETQG